jgi:hypothetical protein
VTRAYVLVTVMPRYSRSMMASYHAYRPPYVSKPERRFTVIPRWVNPCWLASCWMATPVAFAP